MTGIVARVCLRRAEGSSLPAGGVSAVVNEETRNDDRYIRNGCTRNRSRNRQRFVRDPYRPVRDRQARQAGGRLRRGVSGRRNDVAFGDDRVEAAEGQPRLLPADGGRRGTNVRGRPYPRCVLPPRG